MEVCKASLKVLLIISVISVFAVRALLLKLKVYNGTCSPAPISLPSPCSQSRHLSSLPSQQSSLFQQVAAYPPAFNGSSCAVAWADPPQNQAWHITQAWPIRASQTLTSVEGLRMSRCSELSFTQLGRIALWFGRLGAVRMRAWSSYGLCDGRSWLGWKAMQSKQIPERGQVWVPAQHRLSYPYAAV